MLLRPKKSKEAVTPSSKSSVDSSLELYVNYLHKLQQTTGKRPKGRSIVDKTVTILHIPDEEVKEQSIQEVKMATFPTEPKIKQQKKESGNKLLHFFSSVLHYNSFVFGSFPTQLTF